MVELNGQAYTTPQEKALVVLQEGVLTLVDGGDVPWRTKLYGD